MVLIDNSSSEEAIIIQKKIQDLITEKIIKFEKAVGVILYVKELLNKHDLKLRHRRWNFNLSGFKIYRGRKRFVSDKNVWIERRRKNIAPENMLGFMIFVNVENDEYIHDITMKIIMSMDSFVSCPSKLAALSIHLQILWKSKFINKALQRTIRYIL